MSERKIAVYLTTLDWQAVQRLLLAHIETCPSLGKPVWLTGRDRIKFIHDQIGAVLERQ